jgi:hypothetical protein
MKNILIILLLALVLVTWYYYNVSQNNKLVEDAKKEMWIVEESSVKPIKETEETKEKKEVVKKETIKPTYSITKLDSKYFIELDNLDSKIEALTEKIEITWKILNDKVDKIIVNFRNISSDFPNDRYELSKFKLWNETFEYNADSKFFRNIDYWNNEYLIESYIWDDISKLQLNIKIPEDLWEVLVQEKKDPAWVKQSSYLGLTWFNVWKDSFDNSKLTSDNIWKSDSTWYLNKNIDSSYVYWNTHRNIVYNEPTKGISFYVLRKEDKKYIYEKYYFDFKNSIKWILKIKEFDLGWESISVEMSELNDRLKKENDSFEVVQDADKVFEEMVK